jgi:hypothetical protein
VQQVPDEVAAIPDAELLGVVVHSGLVLAASDGVVVALRRITAFPTGLALDVVVLARGVYAEAAGRREREATAQRAEHERKQAEVERQYPPDFAEGDAPRLGVLGPTSQAVWLDAYRSTSSGTNDRYRLEASYWVTPLPAEGFLTLVCAWPEIGLSEAMTDVVLPDLAVRAAEACSLWDLAGGA